MPASPALTVTAAQRRARLVARHHLAGDAPDAEAVVRAVVALHASDPATPYLAVQARTHAGGIHDLDAALYERRTLWRLHAMRRTMFVVEAGFAPVVDVAASQDVAATERAKLLGWLAASWPDAEVAERLAAIEAATLDVLDDGSERSTRELTTLVPDLATRVRLGSGRWTAEASLASRVLFLLALDGQVVRTRPAGTWRSSQYRWARVDAWFVGGASDLTAAGSASAARAELLRRYLATHAPATDADLRWWSGWTVARVRAALAEIEAVTVPLADGGTAYVLPDDPWLDGADEPVVAPAGPVAALLPGLDPSPMGYKDRSWFLGPHADELFDTNGNAGPTVWLDGRIVGAWAQRSDGPVVTGLLEPVGPAARAAIDERAAALTAWLDGTVVSGRFPSPMERRLAER